MKQIYLFLNLFLLFSLVSCSTMRMNRTSSEPITRSLFNDLNRTISEEDIQKILDGHFVYPDTLRVAVYKFGATSRSNSYYYYGYRDEINVRGQQLFIDTLSTLLQTNGRVKRVNIIPSLMLSSQPNITQLREASVRLQCDLLLVFSATSDIYYKPKIFKKDETKAYATTEAFIMDIRTGLVPFSTLITKDVLTQKLSSEEREEMERRAQNEAVLKTLAEVGERVRVFLKQL